MAQFEKQKRIVSSNIIYYRELRGVKRSDLALQVKISTGHLSAVENGRKTPSVQLLYDIATALNIPVSRLFEERD